MTTEMTARKLLQIDGGDHAFLRRKKRPDYAVGGSAVRIVDLFAGCGGLTLGVAEACRALGRRLEIGLAVEAVEDTWRVYVANFPDAAPARPSNVVEWFDGAIGARRTKKEAVTRQQAGSPTLLVGGPPCQGHSTLNNHTRGDDPKNKLYSRMVRAAEVLEPDHIIIENVPSLKRDRSGVLDRAICRLAKLGYSVSHEVLQLAELGVPQLRARHVLVATTGSPPATIVRPGTLRVSRTLRWAIGDIRTGPGLRDSASALSPQNDRRARWLLAHDEYDLPNRQRPICHRDPTHKYKSMYGRLDWEKPAQTITTGFGSPGQGRYLHPSERRTITPHEAARLQFFPDWFDFSPVEKRGRLQEMIGNAAPPKLTYLIAVDLLGVKSRANAAEVIAMMAGSGSKGVARAIRGR